MNGSEKKEGKSRSKSRPKHGMEEAFLLLECVMIIGFSTCNNYGVELIKNSNVWLVPNGQKMGIRAHDDDADAAEP